jgi:hypothetical protein
LKEHRNHFQLVWGALLALAGVGVFYRIPEVIDRVKTIPVFSGSAIYFVYFCFYLLGILLIWGGVRKILIHLNLLKK